MSGSMHSKPSVSVLIPTHSDAYLLQRSLPVLLGHPPDEIEILIVNNDPSQDVRSAIGESADDPGSPSWRWASRATSLVRSTAIEILLDDARQRAAVGSAARNRCEARWGRSNVLNALEKVGLGMSKERAAA